MGYSKGYRLCHCRMLLEDCLYFLWSDFFSTTVNGLLEAAGDEKIAIHIKIPLVARSEPAMHESVLVGHGIVHVTLHDRRTTHDYFTSLTRWQQCTMLIHNGYVWSYHRSSRARPPSTLWRRI